MPSLVCSRLRNNISPTNASSSSNTQTALPFRPGVVILLLLLSSKVPWLTKFLVFWLGRQQTRKIIAGNARNLRYSNRIKKFATQATALAKRATASQTIALKISCHSWTPNTTILQDKNNKQNRTRSKEAKTSQSRDNVIVKVRIRVRRVSGGYFTSCNWSFGRSKKELPQVQVCWLILFRLGSYSVSPRVCYHEANVSLLFYGFNANGSNTCHTRKSGWKDTWKRMLPSYAGGETGE